MGDLCNACLVNFSIKTAVKPESSHNKCDCLRVRSFEISNESS